METPAPGANLSQYLTFVIAEEEYAIGILRVREIIQFESPTRVPQTSRWIRGVINLRGTVVPVVDLAVKFGLPETEVTRDTCVVIAEVQIAGEETVMGLLADAVNQVTELSADQIEPPPTFGATVHTDYLLGVGRAGARLTLMLDVDKVLSTDEVVMAADAAAGANRRDAGDPAISGESDRVELAEPRCG